MYAPGHFQPPTIDWIIVLLDSTDFVTADLAFYTISRSHERLICWYQKESPGPRLDSLIESMDRSLITYIYIVYELSYSWRLVTSFIM